MSEAFDPYHKWLGIPSAEQPPHHYRLLGIGLFENDPDVIESAADQRMSHLRTFQRGAHSALSQKLLNEVSAAKVCLLAAARKAAYDADLRVRLQPPKPAVNRPLPINKPAPPAVAEPAALIVTDRPVVSRARPKPGASSPLVWWSAGAAALAVLALGAYLVWGRAEARPIVENPSSDHSGPAETLRPKTPSGGQSGGSSTNPKAASEQAGQESAGGVPQSETTAPAESSAAAMSDSSLDEKTAAPGESGPPRAMAPFDAKQARGHQETWAAHLNVPVEQKNSLGMSLVLIPPGEFTMGSTPEQVAAAKKQGEQVQEGAVKWALEHIEAEAPAHRVKISRPFLMSATEVTIGQYRRFVEAASYVTETERFGGGSSTSLNEQDPQKKSLTWRSLSVPADDDSAVGQITWNDAVAFCNWLSETEKKRLCYRGDDRGEWTLASSGDGYRLPTEAEWEFACRAGATTQFSYGDDASVFGEYGSSETVRSLSFPNAAGSKAPNPFGLHDMHANADEWCHDWYSPNFYAESPAEDPTGPAVGAERIRRGGGWNNPLVLNRSAFRGSYAPFWRFGGLGFRVVCVSTTVAADIPSLAASAEKPAIEQPTEMPKPEQPGKKQRSLADLAGEGKGKTSSESEARLAAEEAFTLQQHTGAVTRVAFHPFLPLLASGGKDGQVLLWDLEKKALAGQFAKFNEEVWTAKFSPAGNLLVYANRNHWGSVVPFKDLATNKEVKRLKDFKSGGGAVGSLAYSPDGAFFATGQDDGTVRLWETSGFQEIAPLSVGSAAMSLVFGPIALDRKRKPSKYLLAVGCRDGDVKMLELALTKDKSGARWTFAPSKVEFPKQAGVLCVRFSPDGKLLASSRFGGLISVFNSEKGQLVRDMRLNNANIDWVCFHPEQPWLVAAHWQNRRARIWNYDTGEMLCELPGHTDGVFCAEFSRDGRHVATASADFSIKLWKLSGAGVPEAPKRTARKAKPAAAIVGD